MPIKAVIYLFLVAVGVGTTLCNPFNGIVTFICVTYLRPEIVSYGALAHYRLPFAISVVLCVAVFLKAKAYILPLKNNVTVYFLMLMAFCMIVSSGNSVRPAEGYAWAWYIARSVLFCYAIVMLTDSPEKFGKLIGVNVLGGGFLAVWAFQQHFRGNERLEDVGGGGTGNSNGFAALLLLLLPCILCSLGGNRKRNLLLFLLLCVTLMDIVFTQSRSAVVGLVLATGYLFYLYPAKHKITAAMLIALIIAVAGATTKLGEENYFERINNMLEHKMDVDASAASRKHLWSAAIDVFKDNMLLGVGQQQFKYHVKDYSELHRNTVADAHNTYLLVLAEGGIFTFIFFSSALASFFVYTVRLRRIARQTEGMLWLYKTVVSVEAGIIAFMISCMAHSYVTMEYFYWMTMIPSILLNIITRQRQKQEQRQSLVEAMVPSPQSPLGEVLR